MAYTHLTHEERYQIAVLLGQSLGCSGIAKALSRHASTIRRELKGNAQPGVYLPGQAHRKALDRQRASRNQRRIGAQDWQLVHDYLALGLSPEQVAARLQAEGLACISCEAIYLHIYADKDHGGDLVRLLRCQKTRRKRYASGRERRGVLRNRVGIEERPAIVDARTRLGDWEGDTVIGKGHRGALLTLVERKSRYCVARELVCRHAPVVSEAVIELLRPHKAQCLTLTLDNGKEFADHAFLAGCLDAKVYFAHPYRSWERGLSENTNGLLRQYFPKHMSLLGISRQEVDDAVYRLNHRPRKCLGWLTPHEVFYGLEMRPLN